MQFVKRLHNIFVTNDQVRYSVLPVAAIPIVTTGGAGWAYGAYVEIAASVGTVDAWICGIETATVAIDDFELEIAKGLIAAPIPIAVVVPNSPTIWLPYPQKIVAGTRLSARSRSNAGGNTVEVKLLIATVL